jgi:aminopeptidase I
MSSSDSHKQAERTKNFVLADMESRGSRDNRACASCIRKLAPREIGQVNWHLSEDQACRLCQIAQDKPEAFTEPFCNFLRENPTIFHAVDYFKTKLGHLGFEEVRPISPFLRSVWLRAD